MNAVCRCGHRPADHLPRSTTTPCVAWTGETESTRRWCRCEDFTPTTVDVRPTYPVAPTRVSADGSIAWWTGAEYVVSADRKHGGVVIASTKRFGFDPTEARAVAAALIGAAEFLEQTNPKGSTR